MIFNDFFFEDQLILNQKFLLFFYRTRRLSWMSARNAEREKLEGSLLTVCVDCKEMVVQVNLGFC